MIKNNGTQYITVISENGLVFLFFFLIPILSPSAEEAPTNVGVNRDSSSEILRPLINRGTQNDTLFSLSEFYLLGPFQAGSREWGVDFLNDWGGEDNVFGVDTGAIYPSTLASGGTIKWRKILSKNYKIKLEFPNINWEQEEKQHGWAGVNAIAYLYAYISIAESCIVLVEAERVGRFYVNGIPYLGDIYGGGYVNIPVFLKKGGNHILLRVNAQEGREITFRIHPSPNFIFLNKKDITYCDIILESQISCPIGIPLVNPTEKWVDGAWLLVGEEKFSIPAMAPLSILKFPVRLNFSRIEKKKTGDTIWIPVKVEWGREELKDSFPLRIVDSKTSHRITFISKIDSSCQYYAVLPPSKIKKNLSCLMSLHGAGVEAIGQVGAYRQKEDMLVFAPTNRRPFGFDWQDWGRIDALEVLSLVKKRFLFLDTNRIYLSGHSMGGHGAWHIGLHYADHFAACAPSAGWTSFQLYVPFTLQKSEKFAPTSCLSIRDKILQIDMPYLFVENAKNLPVFVIQGEKDDDVPPFHARFMVSLFKSSGYSIRYFEYPKMGHWWDDPKTPGVDCVDSDSLLDFLKQKKRGFPLSFNFVTTDLSVKNSMYWLRIEEMGELYEKAEIEASLRIGKEIYVKTKNVVRFTVLPLIFTINRIKIDNTIINTEIGKIPVSFVLKNGNWEIDLLKDSEKLKKTPDLWGPIKQAYMNPFLLVYGTGGDEEDTELSLHLSRLKQWEWWWRANGYTRILPDTLIGEWELSNFNLSLFGEIKNFKGKLNEIVRIVPLKIEGEKIKIFGEYVEGKDLACKLIYPNPKYKYKFILLNTGNSKEGMRLHFFITELYSGAGLPDFLVFDHRIKKFGWGGVRLTGIFGNDWKISNKLLFK